MWQLEGHWYCSRADGFDRCPAPTQLNTSVTPAQDRPFADSLGMSLASPEQIRDAQRYRETHMSRGAVATQLVINGRLNGERLEDGSYAIGPPIDGYGYDNLTKEIAGRILPFFSWVGNAWMTLCGIAVVTAILKTLIGCIARVIVLYRDRGLGWWLITALFSTAFQIFRLPYSIWESSVEKVGETPLVEGEQRPRKNPPSYVQLRTEVAALRREMERQVEREALWKAQTGFCLPSRPKPRKEPPLFADDQETVRIQGNAVAFSVRPAAPNRRDESDDDYDRKTDEGEVDDAEPPNKMSRP